MMEQHVLPLGGRWRFELDPRRRGMEEQWFGRELAGWIDLPGTTDDAGFGTGEEKPNLKNLNRRQAYMGAAWYQTEVVCPEEWSGKHITLFLERCLWETALWLDGRKIGGRNSLAAPHIYDLSGCLTPGRHRLTLLIDNANLREETDGTDGGALEGRQDLTSGVSERRKLNCGGHHTMFLMPTYWNGAIGRIELRAEESVWLEQADVYPSADRRELAVKLEIGRLDGDAPSGVRFSLRESGGCAPLLQLRRGLPPETATPGAASKETAFGRTVSLSIPLPVGLRPWDEFEPNLYELEIALLAADGESAASRTVSFGLRRLCAKDGALFLNGNRVFLRGTVEDCTFPLTFHPPMDEPAWDRIFQTAKDYGLNHIRFHSFCPPEAAFAAADRAGFLLQVELAGTSCPDQDEEPEVTEFLQAELERILRAYGNHPSFCFLSMGNEQLVSTGKPEMLRRHQGMLMGKVEYGQTHDPRHLYTCTSHPYTDGRNDDYFVSAWSKKGWACIGNPEMDFGEFQYQTGWENFLCGIRWSGTDPLTTSVYCMERPSLDRDFDAGLAEIDRPFVSHEVGQWEVFPNVEEIPKYAGVLRAGNLEMIRASMEKKGLLGQAADFVRASGQLSLLLYRDEIETLLKTRRLSGFQLLDLFDYPGQGTSTVGILDAFWDSKGLLTPEEFRRFCGPLVPLLRLEKRVWYSDEAVSAKLEAANYTKAGHTRLETQWTVKTRRGETVAQGIVPGCALPAGTVTELGEIAFSLNGLRGAEELTLTVLLPELGARNAWKLWCYPRGAEAEGVPVHTQWGPEVKALLREGKPVLLCPKELKDSLPGVFTTVFWNPQMKKQTGTMGILCNPEHPAFREFPTSYHTDWQWWDVLQNSRTMVLDGLPVQPAVQVIDSFVTNRKLGLLFEARVGAGRLVCCSAALDEVSEDRPASRQLLASIRRYMESAAFAPEAELDPSDLDRFFE